MERSWVSNRDRATAFAGVLLVHAGVLVALLALSGTPATHVPTADLIETFDVPLVTPPPPPPPELVQVETRRTRDSEGAAAPPARRAEATPIVRIDPVIELPPVAPPVITAPIPGQGAAPSQGAAPIDGPGTGAGGSGTGTGSGVGGSGNGGGGSGDGVGPSVIQRTTLTGRSYPRDVLRAWPAGRSVFVAVRVQVDGRPTDCRVDRSSGNPVVDQWTCQLVEQRVRFQPAIDGDGRPYVRWYGYRQAPINF